MKNPAIEIDPESIVPSNRTLTIIWANSKDPDDYKERVSRLVDSLNRQDTIKSVIITVNGSKIYSGLHFEQPTNDPEKAVVVLLKLNQVKLKFVQVLEVVNGHN